MPVILFVYWLLGRLKLNILIDVCKWFWIKLKKKG
jgi:hypothetical protein